jgi:hypothetical protein
MTIQPPNTEQATTQSTPKDISDPNISFADYQRIRRGGTALESQTVQSAHTEEKPQKEQKKSSESDTEETEAKEAKDESEANDSPDEGDADAKDSEKTDKPKKKGGWQRRIDKEVARRRELEREIDVLKKLAIERSGDSSKKDVSKVESKTVEADAAGKPVSGNFDTHAEYVEALTDWKIEQREKKAKTEAEQAKLQSEQQEAVQSYRERAKVFAESHDDFDDVLADADDVQISSTVNEAILSSENGPELAYELAKDKEAFKRICALPPIAAAKAIGRFEAQIASKAPDARKTKETKTITQAPKPLDPVGKGAAAATRKSISDPEISFEDYVRLRRDQIKRRNG